MIPPLIVQTALEKKIDLIAITDHNASANVKSVIEAAKGTGLTVIPGMELQTEEEIHSICLFENLEKLDELQKYVDQNLPNIKNNIEYFGEQFVVDSKGDFIKREERLLLTSAGISLNQAFKLVTGLGGIFIPAHVNREAFGIISHLGFIPPDIPFTTMEISNHIALDKALTKFPELHNFNIIQSGDVHYLDDFLGVNTFEMPESNFNNLKQLLSRIDEIHNIHFPSFTF